MPPSPHRHKPSTREDWLALEYDIQSLFDGAPIDEEDLFAGRTTEVTRVLESVFSRSKHVVLYGERGVGKTSLSNVFWKRLNTPTTRFVVARVQAGPSDDFSSLWIGALEELRATALRLGVGDQADFATAFESVSPSMIRRELQKCGPTLIPVIIVDEYNEILSEDARILTAKLIKEFYDFSIGTTIILIGVAESITQLIGDHPSTVRAINEIRLNRMSHVELREIIYKRANRTVMTFTPDAMWAIIVLSRGLPYFTQTLSKFAALKAIEERRIDVLDTDVEASMGRFIENSETVFKEAYKAATQSNQDNYFKQSLLSCALAQTDDDGFFTANDLVEPYSAIMRERKRIAHFEKHLSRFTSDEGGNVLTKRGGDRKQRFRFRDPMMQPYVIIRGIETKMIDEDAKAILFQREQRSFSI